MARIEHRRNVGGGGRPAPSLARLPLIAKSFLGFAVLTAVLELWSVPVAWWQGATEWPALVPRLAPEAARAAAMVALPAAVAWGNPVRHRTNVWLWRGAVLVALVQLLRYPASLAGVLASGGRRAAQTASDFAG